jgi:hypothetical protein
MTMNGIKTTKPFSKGTHLLQCATRFPGFHQGFAWRGNPGGLLPMSSAGTAIAQGNAGSRDA